MSTDIQQQIPELSYFAKRMNELGVNEDNNKIQILQNGKDNKDEWVDFPIFTEGKKGIDILVYTIEGMLIRYETENSRWKHNVYKITRLEKPIVKKDGSVQKYDLPYKQGTVPFFPPMLVEAYKNKTPIPTLVITEGYFKAFKGALHGIPTVGLSSITHMKDKSGQLHEDIRKLILKCEVQRVIWLMDGDCRNITSKDLEDGIDLQKRPKGFFATCATFKEALNDLNVERYAAHVLSDEMTEIGCPKGLDDLLIADIINVDAYKEDLLNVSKKPKYFYREHISYNTSKLFKYFMLDNVENFILHHAEKRPEILNVEFVFGGTRYKWNKEKNVADVVIPKDAKNYFRVGDNYYVYVEIPNKHNQIERTFHKRQKSTINDDHGKRIFQHIPKYQAFCNVPSHTDFQKVINNCYNMYAPFEHEPEEGDCSTILAFLKHIFGDKEIAWRDPKTKHDVILNQLDLGLDYFTILFQKPQQILPILCLVSAENNTGKTTLAKLLKLMFTQNVAIVGNAELSNDFNASYAGKLLIICDEAKIDKQVVVERVKALSTSDKIIMNAKGKDHVELDFFGKFIFITNNEENFIYASDEDVRYWVRKVPKITSENLDVDMLQKMKDEIPAFLYYLLKRQIKTPERHRMWFDPKLIKTDALKKVVEYSRPAIEKEIRQKVKQMFENFGMKVLYLSIPNIKQLFGIRQEDYYLERILKDRIGVEHFHYFLTPSGKKFDTKESLQLAVTKGEITLNEAHGAIRKAPVKRYFYPVYKDFPENGKTVLKRVDVENRSKPYVFKIEDFLTQAEIDALEIDAETIVLNEANQIEMTIPAPTEEDDLPF